MSRALALFAVLTALGAGLAVQHSGFDASTLGRLFELPFGVIATVVLLAIALVGAEMWRFRTAAAAVGTSLSWLVCFDATVASNFFAWVTPGSALAEPATIYVLARRGVDWGEAVALSFAKTALGMLFIMALTFLSLAAGLAPDLSGWLFAPFISGTAVMSLFAGGTLIAAWFPERVTAWLTPFEHYRFVPIAIQSVERLSRLRGASWTAWAAMFVSHVVYYGSFVGVLVVLTRALGDASLASIVPRALIYQCFTYVAPTPGGAGLAEGMAEVFLGDVLSPDRAVLAVLLYRAVTFYLQVGIGLVYLPFIGGFDAARGRPRGDDPG